MVVNFNIEIKTTAAYSPWSEWLLVHHKPTLKLQKDSPTGSKESLRLLIAVICQRQWTLHSMDTKSAFLQRIKLSSDTLRLWVKKHYGSSRSVCVWLGLCLPILAQQSKGNSADNRKKNVSSWSSCFLLLDQDCHACHVDDFIWGGTQSFSTTLIPQLRSAFQVGREEHVNFCYVGVDIVTVDRKVKIHQENYIQHMQPIHVDLLRAVEKDFALCEKEKDQLRSKIGQIL